MLRGYTEAAVSITSSLVTVVSRFAIQVTRPRCSPQRTHRALQPYMSRWRRTDSQTRFLTGSNSGSLDKMWWVAGRDCVACERLWFQIRGGHAGLPLLGTRHCTEVCWHTAQVGVSLVLSFMVVWDLPAIGAGVSSLRTSRLAPFYNEVAPSLAVFGQLFGKALQAQARAPPSADAHMLLCGK